MISILNDNYNENIVKRWKMNENIIKLSNSYKWRDRVGK